MSHRFLLLAMAIVGASTAGLAVAKESTSPASQSICNDIVLIGHEKIDFSDSEKRLICGDPDIKPWSQIPHSQAAFHIQTFLQERGYFQPVFTESDHRLTVEIGSPTYIQGISLTGEPDSLDIRKRRKIKGERLTPKRLSALEGWIRQRLRATGYPCPEFTSTANPVDGKIDIHVESGPFQSIASITEEPIEDLTTGVLRRYDAFEMTAPYNGDFLALTSHRIESEGFLQSNYFSTECGTTGAALVQHVIAGPPRLLSFGFGVNTEGIVLGKASWKHTRLGRLGSLLDLTALASFNRQELDLLAEWYFLDPPSRFHFEPLLSVIREDENEYHYLSMSTRLSPAMRWDTQTVEHRLIGGPALEYIRTFEGASTGFTRFVSMEVDYQLKSHYFEFYRASPRTGYSLTSKTELNHNKLLSDFTVQRFNLRGEYLWNLNHYDPPLLVLGVRGALLSTVYNDDPARFDALPPNFLYFLGGSADLRGFGRKELPERDRGVLTAAFLGFEARVPGVIPHGIQPFVFVDVGALGEDSFRPSLPIFWSPGVGIRWESRFGSFRVTAAHGFVEGRNTLFNDDVTHWQFYFSFGEEF